MRALSLKVLEEALRNADTLTRHRTLHEVATLFLENAPRYDEEKVGLFDDVFGVLVEGSTQSDMADISCRMAPVENAPRKLIKRFAEDPEISIAGPVLTQSPRLSTDDLCDIARSKSGLHMLAISRRAEISEPVTDILLERGDHSVAKTVVGNMGARLSIHGIEHLLDRGQTDHRLTEGLHNRSNVSAEAIREATERLSDAALRRNWFNTRVKSRMKLLAERGCISETQVREIVHENDYEGAVAALSVLSKLNCDAIQNILQPNRISGAVVVCKALGFTIGTVDAILTLLRSCNRVDETEATRAHREFMILSRATAERIIRFWQIRQTVQAS